MGAAIRGFFRRGGKIIPIRMAAGAHRSGRIALSTAKAGALGGSAYETHRAHTRKKSLHERLIPVKVNRKLDAVGLGASVASGVIGAATFHSSLRGLLAGQVVGHVIDAGGIAANVASVKGHGRLKDRAEQGAKQEARNFLVGNAVFYGGVLAQKKTREGLKVFGKKALTYGAKLLRRRV
jgi:hypothetical protein